jgi:hypothetical protein
LPGAGGPATLAPHGWDRIDQREQLGDVVGVPLVSIAKLHLRGPRPNIRQPHCPQG